MTANKQKSPSKKELRKFGIAFSVFLSLITTVVLWKHGWVIGIPYMVVYSVSGILLIIGLIVPQTLSGFFYYWMRFARKVGEINSKIFLTLIFYLVFTPMRLGSSLFGHNPLKIPKTRSPDSFWIPRDKASKTLQDYERQF